MKVKYIVVRLSSWTPEDGYREWYELQPQNNDGEIHIFMEKINEQN